MHNRRRKNNIIIGSLLAIVCIMAVGYAAFATNLNISGSGGISSNWSVKITNITSKNIVGTAGNKSTPSYTNTTATFAATLQSPGDSITYDITVSNAGTIDAVLKTITLNNSNNPAITFETSGLTEGEDLLKNTTKTLTVKVTYKSSVTSQPDTLTANLTVTLDFGQKGVNSEGIVVPAPTKSYVYAWNTDWVTMGTSTLTDLGTSYATFAEAVASNSNSYGVIMLKYTVEKNVLTEGYACFLTSGTEYCLKGYDTSAFANNVAILNTAFPSCGASASGSSALCNGGSVSAGAYSSGYVYALSKSSPLTCAVDSDGTAYCGY